MSLWLTTRNKRRRAAGFTLVEIVVSLLVFSLVSVGIIYGYVQSNRMAQWSAISLAAQSFASQGVEQARAANWNPRGYPPSTGPGSFDELPVPTTTNYTNYIMGGATNPGILDVPGRGTPTSSDFAFFVTNYITVTNLSSNPYLRQIRADAVWRFYVTGTVYTNTAILIRAADQ
jgi:prepilin-type N-terminal cleavage/methylation domain-containing protein